MALRKKYKNNKKNKEREKHTKQNNVNTIKTCYYYVRNDNKTNKKKIESANTFYSCVTNTYKKKQKTNTKRVMRQRKINIKKQLQRLRLNYYRKPNKQIQVKRMVANEYTNKIQENTS